MVWISPGGRTPLDSALAVPGGDELLVLGVQFDVVRDERAERNDLQPLTACVRQRLGGEPAAEALAFAGFVHLGVRKGNAAVSPPVREQTDQAPAEPKLVAARLGHLDDLGLLRCAGG